MGKKKRAKSPAIIVLAGLIARSYSGGYDGANTGIGIESEVPLKTGVLGTGTRELRIKRVPPRIFGLSGSELMRSVPNKNAKAHVFARVLQDSVQQPGATHVPMDDLQLGRCADPQLHARPQAEHTKTMRCTQQKSRLLGETGKQECTQA